MNSFVEKMANSRFMKKLEEISFTVSGMPSFSALSNGMGGAMGFIMIGAVVQVICVIGTTFFDMSTEGQLYQILQVPYTMTMGILAFFLAFNVANGYAKNLKMKSPVMCGLSAIVYFFLVACPLQTATLSDGSTIKAINIDNMGGTSMFVALVIAFASVRIHKFVVDHNWVIKMPDSVPEGILNSFNSIIPVGVNILVWYGIATILNVVSDGALTLSSLIIRVLSIPVNFLISVPGMFVVNALICFLWFFGIHGTGVVFTVIMVPMFMAYQTNAALAAQGLPLEFSPVFLFSAVSIIGGTGNTLPLVVLGLRAKSKSIKAISKAGLVPNVFNINEPVIFGMPVMYNAILFIPYLLNVVVITGLYYLAIHFGLVALPQVLILTTLPILFAVFMSTLDFKNVIFAALMFPVAMLIWYPFFKIYDKQCYENELAEEAGELETAKA